MPSSASPAFEALKEYMKQNYNVKLASGGREILKRCHFCGDSRDPSQAHLYIGLKNNAIVYNCFKCNSSGIVDGKFMRNLGCYDPNIITLCNDQKKKYSDSKGNSANKLKTFSVSKPPIIPLSNNEFAQRKLMYLSERLGYIFTTSDAAKFKIILNLKDFLAANHIERYTRQPEMVDNIDKFFIGFLSMDNRYVILKRLVPEGKLPPYIDYKYINYDIFGGYEGGVKYFTIPNIIYPTLPIDIHIAEGAFDILSIYLHVAPLGSNAVYGAICGKSYLSLVRFLITTYGFTNFNLHLYPDADIGLNKMKEIKEDVRPFGAKVFVHRNIVAGQKDYGVSMDLINDSITKI